MSILQASLVVRVEKSPAEKGFREIRKYSSLQGQLERVFLFSA
jgi:hypothetical protein